MNLSGHDADSSGKSEKSHEMRDAVGRNILWLQAYLEEYHRNRTVPITWGQVLTDFLGGSQQAMLQAKTQEQVHQTLVQSGDPRVIIPLLEFNAGYGEEPRLIEKLAGFGESAVLPALEASRAKNLGCVSMLYSYWEG